MAPSKEYFTSRWGLVLSVIGVAIGTGNIWRFSRIVAQNGGGTFLIPWVVFLLIWSVPLIIAEMAIGKSTRKSSIGAFLKMAGKKYAWMGAFVAFVSMAIMFYYSVVAGWCLRFLFTSLKGFPAGLQDHAARWRAFAHSPEPVLFHFLSMAVGVFIIYKGVVKGIERTNRILIPLLLLILVVLGVRAVTLPGALRGIEYLFTPDFKALLNVKVWLAALAQNAWDTGAGWGLILVYSSYMRKKEDMALNAMTTGFSNNSISLLAGIIIFSTIFAVAPDQINEVVSGSGSTNEGLAFIFLPRLFQQMRFGEVIQVLFFLALFMAALTSLISMIELVVSNLVDLGLKKRLALLITGAGGFLLGVPSALSLGFFGNQDWAWGIGLIFSGFFIAFAVSKYGPDLFRRKVINGEGSDIKIGKWYTVLISVIIPLEAVLLIVWWFFQSLSWDRQWWNPFHKESIGTCLFQYLLVIALFLILNRTLVKLILRQEGRS